jgi:hypothetical protein
MKLRWLEIEDGTKVLQSYEIVGTKDEYNTDHGSATMSFLETKYIYDWVDVPTDTRC